MSRRSAPEVVEDYHSVCSCCSSQRKQKNIAIIVVRPCRIPSVAFCIEGSRFAPSESLNRMFRMNTWRFVVLVFISAQYVLGQLPEGFGEYQFQTQAPMPLLDLVTRLGAIPEDARMKALSTFGELVKLQLKAKCNIFGGQESCVEIDSNSALGKLCPEYQPIKIDCLYYSEDIIDQKRTPIDQFKADLRAKGKRDLERNCPECLDNMRKMWCAQAIPKCGTFTNILNGVLIPAVQQLTSKYQPSSTSKDIEPSGWQQMNDEDMAEWAPAFQQNVSLYMPCREMCESIVKTCACDTQKTFGDIFQTLLPQFGGEQHSQFVQALEQGLKDKHICSLFSYSTTPAFSGHCVQLEQSCKHRDSWCDEEGKGQGINDSEKFMVGPILKSVFGWGPADDDSGKYVIHSTKADDQSSSGSSAAVIVLSVLLALAVCVLLGIGGYWYYQRRQDTLDYVSMLELNDTLEPL